MADLEVDQQEAQPADDMAIAEAGPGLEQEMCAMREQFTIRVFATAVFYISVMFGCLIAFISLLHTNQPIVPNFFVGAGITFVICFLASTWAQHTDVDLTAFEPSYCWQMTCSLVWMAVFTSALVFWVYTGQTILIFTIVGSGTMGYVFLVVFTLHTQIVIGGRIVETPIEDHTDEALIVTVEVTALYICIQVITVCFSLLKLN